MAKMNKWEKAREYTTKEKFKSFEEFLEQEYKGSEELEVYMKFMHKEMPRLLDVMYEAYIDGYIDGFEIAVNKRFWSSR